MILTLGFAASLAAGCVSVDGDRILGSDLARADAAFSSLAPDTVIAFAPRPGARRAFSAAELAQIAARYGIGKAASRDACFERSWQEIDTAALLAAMKPAFPEARIEVVEYSHFRAPRGRVEFPVEGLSAPAVAGPSQNVARWRGFVVDSEGRKTSIWARVKVMARVARVMAVTDLKAGEPVSAAQVRVEERESFPLGRAFPGRPDEVLGRRPRRTIAAGTVIESALLEEPHDVERGSTVEAEVRSGAIVLKTEAIAESSGRKGESVIVKNASTGKKFTARVEGKNKVVVRGS